MTDDTLSATLPTLVVETETIYRPESRCRADDAPRLVHRYAGQAFAWHRMNAAERAAMVARCKVGRPGRPRPVRRNYCCG